MKNVQRKYEIKINPSGTEVIFFEENGMVYCIPTTDPSNSDYQQYLAWLNGEAKKDGVM